MRRSVTSSKEPEHHAVRHAALTFTLLEGGRRSLLAEATSFLMMPAARERGWKVMVVLASTAVSMRPCHLEHQLVKDDATFTTTTGALVVVVVDRLLRLCVLDGLLRRFTQCAFAAANAPWPTSFCDSLVENVNSNSFFSFATSVHCSLTVTRVRGTWWRRSVVSNGGGKRLAMLCVCVCV